MQSPFFVKVIRFLLELGYLNIKAGCILNGLNYYLFQSPTYFEMCENRFNLSSMMTLLYLFYFNHSKHPSAVNLAYYKT